MNPIPSIVLAIAEQEKMTPISWKVTNDLVVICYAEGPKKTYERTQFEAQKAKKTTRK